MPATIDDPAAIESEINDLEARRDRLQEKREGVQDELQDARQALQSADTDEGEDEALDRAERLQIRADTLTEAITEVEVDLEALRDSLEDARAARRREEKLEALAERGRAAVEAREAYDALRDEILELLREKAPELARRYSAWTDAAKAFRDALVREESHVQRRRSSTTEEDVERAEALISELKDRGVLPFKDALRPHASPRPEQWFGWSHENGYSGPDGQLGDAIEAVRAVGRDDL
jgi:chromosome segregation ATPase